MDRLYVFLIHNDIWIYILCTLGLLWYVGAYLRSRALLRGSVFGLERERARSAANSALTFSVMLVAIVGSVAYVNVEIRPNLPEELLRPPPPTPNPFRTPFASPTPLGGQATATADQPTPELVPTVTLVGGALTSTEPGEDILTPSGTPFTAEVSTAPCPSNATIIDPVDGAQVSGAVSFFGTATSENFAFYELEVNGPETRGIWASILTQSIEEPVNGDLLGTLNMTSWAAGRYSVRLVVADRSTNDAGSCTIQLELLAE